MFQGRTDFLGAEDGGCIRLYGGEDLEWVYQGHLTGTRPPIGIYPVTERRRPLPANAAGSTSVKSYEVKFGAVDIDFEDLALAKNIRLALQAMDITSWIERSRSKGYHVWVFSTEWVPAVLMRSALQVACDVVGYSPKEIFPKQTELADGSPGNYIRLPYPGALLRPVHVASRRVVLDVDTPTNPVLDLETWLPLAWDSRVSRRQLEEAASLAPPPKVKHRGPVLGSGTSTPEVAALVPKMGGLAFTIFEYGPLDGADRSSTLFKLVHAIHDSGLTADEAFVLLQDADSRWGKFYDRADGESRLWEIVERVYDE